MKVPAPSFTRKEQRVDTQLQPPGKYEITPEQTFSFSFYVKPFKGRWVISNTEKDSEEHTVTFRVWSFDEMLDLRKRATSFDPVRRVNIIDNDLLNRLKIQKLLVSWSLGDSNPRLAIQHVNGVLTDESWKAFTKLVPCIAERIINEMNMVLEYGG